MQVTIDSKQGKNVGSEGLFINYIFFPIFLDKRRKSNN